MDDEEKLTAGGIGRAPVVAAEANRQVAQYLGGILPARCQLGPDLSLSEVVRPDKHAENLPCDHKAEPALIAEPVRPGPPNVQFPQSPATNSQFSDLQ